jgi:hypothetical protein
MPDTAAPDGWPAIWPTPGDALFATPDEAALGFVRDFLGMGPEANIVSSQPTVERAGVLVDVRPRNNGTLITHVQTRAVGNGWVVEAAHADSIELATGQDEHERDTGRPSTSSRMAAAAPPAGRLSGCNSCPTAYPTSRGC